MRQPEAIKMRDFQASETWPEPDMSVLRAGIRPAPDLPKDCFGAAAEIVLAEARARACPPDYIAGGLLAVAASLIGNARTVNPSGAWSEPSALFVALVGSPSSGKSPALDAVLRPFEPLEKQLAQGFKATVRDHKRREFEAKLSREDWEKLAKDAHTNHRPVPDLPEAAELPDEPVMPRLRVADATIEALGMVCAASPQGVLITRDELAGWIGNLDKYGGEGNRAFFLEGFGGRAYQIDRKSLKEPIMIDRLLFSILGGLQPDKLASALLSGDDDGLAARFLYFWPDVVPFEIPDDIAPDERIAEAMARLNSLSLEKGANGELTPNKTPLSPSAFEALKTWGATMRRQCEAETGLLSGFYGKAAGGALRLALVFELLDWALQPGRPEPTEIGLDAVERAIRLYLEYLIPMAARAFGDAACPVEIRNAAHLGRKILERRESVINARVIYRKWGLAGLNHPEPVKAAIDVLGDAGWLQFMKSHEGAGRHRGDYAVNPRFWRAK